MSNYSSGVSELHHKIRKIMKRKKYWKPHQILDILNAKSKKRISESTLTRELRRMTDLTTRYCYNDAWDYSLEKVV